MTELNKLSIQDILTQHELRMILGFVWEYDTYGLWRNAKTIDLLVPILKRILSAASFNLPNEVACEEPGFDLYVNPLDLDKMEEMNEATKRVIHDNFLDLIAK